MSEVNFILAIETAVQGGSISLLRGVSVLDCWIGSREVSKSEDILEEINKILKRNDLEKKSIKKIIVSRGPGSYTGARIGIATGYGLKKALGCELFGASVLEALLAYNKEKTIVCEGEVLTAIPIGRDQICRQSFKLDNQGQITSRTQPVYLTIDDFSEFFSEREVRRKIILHRKLFLEFQETLKNQLNKNIILIDAGSDVASLMGMMTIEPDAEHTILRPIYIRDSSFPSEN